MKITQFFLLPFAFIYSLGVKWWTWMYKKGYWGKASFSLPVISVGNLQAGGTGKTPMVDYLCGYLSNEYQVGVLSRGYKRLTYGFRMVHVSDDYKSVGDEPYWLKRRYPHIAIGVAENRVEGIPYLISNAMDTDVLILDDGYQQLGIRVDLNILMTPFHRPYTNDYFLPAGRLRESRSSAERADIIIVTKCPENELGKKDAVLQKLGIRLAANQKAFLSALYYAQPYSMYYEGEVKSLQKDENILLVTGIGDAEPLLKHIEGKVKKVKHLSFPDHYRYRISDIETIAEAFMKFQAGEKSRIITTEKDAVRLISFRKEISALELNFFVQPILLKWDDEDELKRSISIIF